jgi:hypothetical protein
MTYIWFLCLIKITPTQLLIVLQTFRYRSIHYIVTGGALQNSTTYYHRHGLPLLIK